MSNVFDQFDAKPKEFVVNQEVTEKIPEALPANDAPVEFSFTEMAMNAPGSAYKVGESIVRALMNPIDSELAVGALASSMVIKAGRKVAEVFTGEDIPAYQEQGADQFIDAMDERYGSMDAFKRTAMEDPAGMSLDAAGVLTPMKIPTAGIKGLLRGAQKAIPKNAPVNLYERVAKFSTTLTDKERAAMARTAIDQGIIPSSKGIKKLDSKIESVGTELDRLIKTATDAGTEIPVASIMDHMQDLRRTKGGIRLGSKKDIEALDRLTGEFQELVGNRKTLTPTEVQKFKQSAYEDINWNAKRQTGTPIDESAYKAMARGSKDAVSKAVPGSKAANQILGDMLELKPNLSRSAARIGNRNMFSIMMPLWGGGIGATFGGNAGIAAALATMAFNPKMKARLAIAMDKFKKNDLNWVEKNLGTPEVAILAAVVEQQATEPSQ